MEQIPIDYTGRGPSGTGYAPTNTELRRQQRNRYYSDSNSELMSYIDPSVVGASEIAMRAVSKTNDPAEVRRLMYGSAQGQAARDMAMAARHSGNLGYGDPVNYAHNMMRGVTSSGFTVDTIGKDDSGRSVFGMNQRVTGNGAIAERVSQNFTKGMFRDLYGSGSTDPSKLNGFDMEEASGVAATVMRNGGIGKAATVIRNADTQTRLNAARDAATDPGVKEGLAKTAASTNKELEAIIKTTKDPKLKAALEGVHGSTDAVLVNSDGRKKVAETVREVTRGMAALSDMYGELSAPELHAKLESITGQKIVNKSQAKQAARLVNDMRNGAEAAGMDPRAFMDFASQSQTMMRGRVAEASGMDERDGQHITKLNAEINGQIMTDSLLRAQSSQQVVKDAAELGWSGFEDTGKDATEIAKDKQDRRMEFNSRFVGVAAAADSADRMVKKGADGRMNKDIATDLIRQWSTENDPTKKDALTQQIQNIYGKEFGADGSFDSARHAGAFAGSEKRGQIHNKIYDNQAKVAEEFSMSGIDKEPIKGIATETLGMDNSTAKAFSKVMTEKVGSVGMMGIAKIAKGPDKIGDVVRTADDRKKEIHDYLINVSHANEDEAQQITGALIGTDGRFKNEETARDAGLALQTSSRGDATNSDKSQETEAYFNNRSKEGKRNRVRNDEDKVTIASIANALIKKNIKGVDDPETQALALEALQQEGGMKEMMVDEVDSEGNKVFETDEKGKSTNKVKRFDLMGEKATGINFRQGFTKETMEKLKKVNGGKDLGLAAKMHMTEEELATRSATDLNVVKDGMKILESDPDYEKLNVSGDPENASVTTDRAQAALRNMKDGPEQRIRRVAAARSMFPGMTEKDNNTLTEAAAKGDEKAFGAATKATFAADDYKGEAETKGTVFGWGNGGDWRTFAHLKNNKKMTDMAGAIGAADPDMMENYAEMNKDGALTDSIQKQLTGLRAAQGNKVDTVISEDGSTQKVGQSIKALEDALKKLESVAAPGSGSQTIGTMTVTNMKVINKTEDK